MLLMARGELRGDDGLRVNCRGPDPLLGGELKGSALQATTAARGLRRSNRRRHLDVGELTTVIVFDPPGRAMRGLERPSSFPRAEDLDGRPPMALVAGGNGRARGGAADCTSRTRDEAWPARAPRSPRVSSGRGSWCRTARTHPRTRERSEAPEGPRYFGVTPLGSSGCDSRCTTSTNSRALGTPGAEHRLLQEALAQVELADRLGYDAVWVAEHHFLEEASRSQRTRRLPAPPPPSGPRASGCVSVSRRCHSATSTPRGSPRPLRRSTSSPTDASRSAQEGSTGAEPRGLRRRPRDYARPVGRGDRDRRADDGRDPVRRRRWRPHQDAATQRRPQAAGSRTRRCGSPPRSARPTSSPPSRGSGAQLHVRRSRGGKVLG